jgi:hypothetical protein
MLTSAIIQMNYSREKQSIEICLYCPPLLCTEAVNIGYNKTVHVQHFTIVCQFEEASNGLKLLYNVQFAHAHILERKTGCTAGRYIGV